MLVTLGACGGVGEYRPMGGTYAARGPGCDYRVIRNRIVEPYEEIGVIDIEAFTVRQFPPTRSVSARSLVRTCAAQGATR
mgnify:CR=1 FL=1